MAVGWRVAMASALYGPDGFFVAGKPVDHFRTSVHASPLFAGALLDLVERVDTALGHPGTFDIVDVGAGRGELITTLQALLPKGLAARARFTGVEVVPKPKEVGREVHWRRQVPEDVVGVLLATEWLDNVPLDVVETDDEGRLRRVLVDRKSGEESLGPLIDAADRFWLARWWPVDGTPGERAEVGWPRDVAWADAVGKVRKGCALAVDYGHRRRHRPGLGTLTGFRGGRQVRPVPDGGCDLTAHVAMDAAACAVGTAYTMITQRDALRALGVDAGRPSLDLARTDPGGYVRALAAAGAAGELIDPAGLGGHQWLVHGVGIEPPLPARLP
jgi:SAM-dependent MidA family methyltransferase